MMNHPPDLFVQCTFCSNYHAYGINFLMVPAFADDATAVSLWCFLADLLLEVSLWLLKA
jgi:hypothetical protein